MPDETPNQTPETTNEDMSQDVQLKIGDSPEVFDAVIVTTKGKGKAANKLQTHCILKGDLTSLTWLGKIAQAVGIVNFVNTVWKESIKPACIEATADAIEKVPEKDENGQPVLDENGQPVYTDSFSALKWAKSFINYFAPADRRKGGMKLSEIQQRMSELSVELAPLAANFKDLTPDDKMRMLRLVDEITTLAAKRQAKLGISEKAKASKLAKAAKAATPAG